MPVIENLEEINQVHSNLFYKILCELVLIYANMNVFDFLIMLFFELH
jgi:hypothetical protein